MEKLKNILKNKKVLLGIIILVIAIIALVAALLLNRKTDDKEKEDTEGDNPTINVPFEEAAVTMNCRLASESTEEYTSSIVEVIEVDDENRILRSSSTMEIVYSNEAAYNTQKNNEEYAEGKSFFDESLTIVFSNGDLVDYTENEYGEENRPTYEAHKEALEAQGYTCN